MSEARFSTCTRHLSPHSTIQVRRCDVYVSAVVRADCCLAMAPPLYCKLWLHTTMRAPATTLTTRGSDSIQSRAIFSLTCPFFRRVQRSLKVPVGSFTFMILLTRATLRIFVLR